MVTARKAVEQTYTGHCTIYEKGKVKKANGSTGFEDTLILENRPCRLSFSRINSTADSNNAQQMATVVKLFIDPDITIKPGSKIVVTQNGGTNIYGSSGEPAVYFTHQEYILDSFGGYA